MEIQIPPKRKGKPGRHPRLRLLLKIAFGLFLVFALIVAVQFILPLTHRGALLELLTPPEGCEAPCFMGVRPGETTIEEALAILEAHEWVEEGSVVHEYSAYASWEWSGSQPEAIYRGYSYPPGYLYYDEQGVVSYISITTDIPFGAIPLTFGYTAIWPEHFMVIQGATCSNLCSNSHYDYWHFPVGIVFYAPESNVLYDYDRGYIPYHK